MAATNLDYNYFECRCNDPAHALRFVVDNDTGAVWVDVKLRSFGALVDRLKAAAAYVAMPSADHHEYAYSSLKVDDLKRLRDLLDEAIRRQESTRVPS